MSDLHYATLANERHDILVKTEMDGDLLVFMFQVDGRVLDSGLIDPDGEVVHDSAG